MNWYRQVHKLQVDITSHCNARCGACIRNIDGGETRPGLELSHFDLDLWKRIASEDTKGWYVRLLTLNGNWGDPMMHPHLVEMLKYWTDHHPETFISIATNGSMRGVQFWADLAKVLRNGCQHKIDFAIDGMEDTHHIYRRKTIFSKIVENIKSFTNADGVAQVVMTMFEHNKHQINEVKELAKEMGARQFNARQSHTDKMEIIDGDENYHIKAYYPKEKATHREIPADIQEYFPENDKPFSDLRDGYIFVNLGYDSFESAKEFKVETKCPWKQAGEVQIDPWGIVWPCCHISLYGGGRGSDGMSVHNDFNKEAENLINNGKEENNLHNDSLHNILNNKWFNTTVDNAVENADWKICRRNCGVCK
jgi:MoaA/NifB/PqqE/SkfB family radical SAM enzyme